MFWLQYSRYLIACSLSASEVLSLPQLEGSTNPDVERSQEIYLNTPSSSQGSFIALNSQENSAPNLVIEPNYSPASQDSAFVPFDENGGLTNVIPSFPSFPQLNNLFPQGNHPDPKVPQDTQTDATERKKPDCNDGKFAFCCQQGPPSRSVNIKGLSRDELSNRQRERKSRLRKCRKWSINDPACDIPANEACCTCVSKRQEAFFCYNPHGITSPPQPVPLLPDPNPSEPDIPGIPRRKRDPHADDRNIGRDLLVANMPSWKRPGGRPRFESTCSDEFMENLGLSTGRYHKPAIHTPNNPFQYSPNRKRPDTREEGWMIDDK